LGVLLLLALVVVALVAVAVALLSVLVVEAVVSEDGGEAIVDCESSFLISTEESDLLTARWIDG
jgi:uncharacterized membrane protein